MKNAKLILTNCGLIILSILTLVFLSQGYVKILWGYSSGYDTIDFDANENRLIMTAISNLIITIIACLIIIVAFVGLLKAFNAIKMDKKTEKVLNIINFVFAIVTLAFSIIGFSCLTSCISELGFELGWAAIANLIIAAFVFVIALIQNLTCKSKKKSK